MVSLAMINGAIEKVDGVSEAYTHRLSEFQDGSFSRNKNGKLRIQISLPASDVVVDDVKGIPLRMGDWKLIPLLVFVRVDFKDEVKKDG